MILKDRYSKAIIFLAIGAGISIYYLRADKGYLAALWLLFAVLPFAGLLTRPAKLHLTDAQKSNPYFLVKTETDCSFKNQIRTEIDGVKIGGKRFKAVNGTDIYIDGQQAKNCGPCSALMQWVGGGGAEPKSIQNDACWQ